MVKKLWMNPLIHLLPWRWRLNVPPKCGYLSIYVCSASSPEYRSIKFNCCRNFRFYKGMSQGKLTCNYRRTVGYWFTLRANTLFSTFEQLSDPPHSADRSSPWRSEFLIRAEKSITPPTTRSHQVSTHQAAMQEATVSSNDTWGWVIHPVTQWQSG